MNKNLSKNIIETIKQSHMKPIKKSYFTFRKSIIFALLTFSLIVGALSFGIILGYGLEADWFLQNKIGFISIVSKILPFFWIVFLGISLIFSYLYFKNTPRGYKFYIWQIFFLSFLLTGIAGAGFYASGISQSVEDVIENKSPTVIQNIVGNKQKTLNSVWQNEEKGLLIGDISVHSDGTILLKDTRNMMWKITLSEQVLVGKNLNNKQVKVIGKKLSKDKFFVEQLFIVEEEDNLYTPEKREIETEDESEEEYEKEENEEEDEEEDEEDEDSENEKSESEYESEDMEEREEEKDEDEDDRDQENDADDDKEEDENGEGDDEEDDSNDNESDDDGDEED